MENKKDKKWYLQLGVLDIVFAVLSLVFLICTSFKVFTESATI